MIPVAWDEIEALELGLLERGAGDAAAPITGIKADSRAVGPGDLFVALNTGVDFVDEAAASGAATLVPDDQEASTRSPRLPRPREERRARRRRRRLDGEDVDQGHLGRALPRRRARRSPPTRARTTRSAFRSPFCRLEPETGCS